MTPSNPMPARITLGEYCYSGERYIAASSFEHEPGQPRCEYIRADLVDGLVKALEFYSNKYNHISFTREFVDGGVFTVWPMVQDGGAQATDALSHYREQVK